jgi:hypothetical protein
MYEEGLGDEDWLIELLIYKNNEWGAHHMYFDVSVTMRSIVISPGVTFIHHSAFDRTAIAY